MKIIINIGHPAHVHFYRNAILELEKRGHEILVTARAKEIVYKLLDIYDIPYFPLTKKYKTGFLGQTVEMIERDIKLYNLTKKFKPDIITGIASENAAHVSKVTKASSIIFTDTEHTKFASTILYPFADAILTPSCFKKDLGRKQVRYKGYHELAYLHPNYFKPNPEVLDELNLSKNDKFVILRFVSWTATHDIGQKGFSLESKIKLVKELEKYAKVFITSEAKLENDLEKYRVTISPEKMHDLLYYATMYIGEGATMASEAAILGTPAIYVNTLRLGYTDEEEEKYNLLFNFPDPINGQKQAYNKALELIEKHELKKEWQKKRENLLNDKIDVTKFMVNFIENYPESFNKIKN